MLDIKRIRLNPEEVEAALKSRGCDWKASDFLLLDEKKRALLSLSEEKKSQRNAVNKKMGMARKAGASEKELETLAQEARALSDHISQLDAEMISLDESMNQQLLMLPNLPDDSASLETRRTGDVRVFPWEPKTYAEIGSDLHIAQWTKDPSAFPVLRGQGARVYRALSNALLNELAKQGSMEIHSSASSLLSLFQNSILDGNTLPLVSSTCSDAKQIDVLAIAKPEERKAAFQQMIVSVENILQMLSLPCQISSICPSELPFNAANACAIEVWLPSVQRYVPAGICSDCTDFDARSLIIRFREQKGEKPHLVFTLCASISLAALLAALLENHQNEDGTVAVPEALVPLFRNTIIG